MGTMNLKPSKILFSQDAIGSSFNERSLHSYKKIGETLDDICEGRCTIHDIPIISVMRKGNAWITADNRRLWIFQNLERLGKCQSIEVKEILYIPPGKMTSTTNGRTIKIRGDPGGNWHQRSETSNGPSVVTGIAVAGAALLFGMLLRQEK